MDKKNVKVFFPPYFAKRKAKMNKELIKKLEEAAASDPVVTDEYGEYRLGVFLHGSCVVTVGCEDGAWSCQIYSEQPITQPVIKTIRYKYLPDVLVMAQLFTSREIDRLQKSVVLYEIPAQMIGYEDKPEQEAKK